MADAVYDARISNSQLSSESETDSNFESGLARLERDLKSLRSAAATFSDRGRALIDRLKAIEANVAAARDAPEQREGLSPLDVVDRLNELTNFVDCAWLAARSVGDHGDRDGLSTVLDHAAMGLRRLSEEIHPPPSATRTA